MRMRSSYNRRRDAVAKMTFVNVTQVSSRLRLPITTRLYRCLDSSATRGGVEENRSLELP